MKISIIKILLATTIALLLCSPGISHEILTEWKVAKQSGEIQVSYRYIMVGDTLKTREMRVSFTVEAKPDSIVSMFNDADKFYEWSAGIEKCNIIQTDSSSWVMYNLYDVPWPFKQRDLITEYKLVKSDSKTTLIMTGKPHLLPEYEDIMRMKLYEGFWSFESLENGLTHVEFHTISFTDPILPRFLQDPVLQKTFIHSMNKLRALLTG
ncbi:MAG: hypothetical protein DRI69_10645 [Bacteroidetes bacterium]|nr:MAG: hypothetical protein DRI69_10645 [Bacteroidota bacterium]